jgi:hypothetical protein
MRRIIRLEHLGIQLLAAYGLGTQTVLLAFTAGEPQGLALLYKQFLGTLALVAILGYSLLFAVQRLPMAPASTAAADAGEERGSQEPSLAGRAESRWFVTPVLRGMLVLVGLLAIGGGSLVRAPVGWHGMPGLFFVALGGYFLALGTAGFTGVWKERHGLASVPEGGDRKL